MQQMVYTIRLDLRDTGIVNTSLRLKQGDSGIKIVVNVFNGGVAVFDSSTTPKIVFRRPDGAAVMADMTVESSSYSYTLVGNELQVPGKELIDVKFPLGDTGRESTLSCSIEVVPDTITPNTHGSDIYDNDLAELVAEATAAAETVEEVVGDSEAWAVGERNGVPVGPEDPAYHNNSKWWSEQANVTSLAALTDVDLNTPKAGDGLVHDGNDWTNVPIMTKEQWKKNGAYNRCPNDATTQVVQSVTFTVTSDGIITPSGTASSSDAIINVVYNKKLPLSAGHYKMVGCPSDGGGAKYWMSMYGNTGGTLFDYGNGVEFDYNGTDVVTIQVGVYRTKESPSDPFKPMITTDLNATYDDYVPYAKTNGELTLSLIPEDITSQVTKVASEISDYKVYRLGKIVFVYVISSTGIEIGTASWARRSLLTGLPYTNAPNYFGMSGESKTQKIPFAIEMSGAELRCAKEYGATTTVDYSQAYYRINLVYIAN